MAPLGSTNAEKPPDEPEPPPGGSRSHWHDPPEEPLLEATADSTKPITTAAPPTRATPETASPKEVATVTVARPSAVKVR